MVQSLKQFAGQSDCRGETALMKAISARKLDVCEELSDERA